MTPIRTFLSFLTPISRPVPTASMQRQRGITLLGSSYYHIFFQRNWKVIWVTSIPKLKTLILNTWSDYPWEGWDVFQLLQFWILMDRVGIGGILTESFSSGSFVLTEIWKGGQMAPTHTGRCVAGKNSQKKRSVRRAEIAYHVEPRDYGMSI